ncbi:MAG: divalent metal cation transporter, partial [Candidatus Magasanikbacteria bacterium]|nr:divalent metal cation transporter [Candidatus Magasanikbacteria bacterium]
MKKNNKSFFLKRFFSKLGPGVITGASDDDPSGILTYLQAGTVMGLRSLWTALLTLPLMYGVQEMCGRIGFVTKKGLITLIKTHFSKGILYPIALISVVVITINLGADLLAIGVVLEKMFDVGRIFWIIASAIIIILLTVFLSYKKFAQVLKWLTLSLFFYVVAVFYMRLDVGRSLWATFVPHFNWDKESILLLTAIFGTTVSPYLFFWQTNEEAEDREEKFRCSPTQKNCVTKNELKNLKKDTFIGMIFSNVAMWFIMAGATQLAATYGLKVITNFDDASLVLKPLLGNMAYLFFSFGIIGTGFLAVPILGGCVGYIFSEIFNQEEGMN